MARTTDSAEMSSELKALKDEVLRLSETVASYARGEAEHAGAKVRDYVDDLSRRGRDVAETAREGVETATHDVEQHIARNPLASVLIATGIGLILGMMSRQR